jgi:hypothetical protein
MPRFLNATQARGEIESILTKARQNIFMISPYIKVNDDLISRLADAGGRRKVKILLVCRENDLRDEQRKRVEQVPNLELLFNEKVHAKCYFNEDSMVIASLNLYDSAYGDNHEMGILLSNSDEEDRQAFRDARDEAAFIIAEDRPKIRKVESSTRPYQAKPAQPEEKETVGTSIAKGISRLLGLDNNKGYCIRCGTRIDMDKAAPYCPDCYRVWAKYKNPAFEEQFCRACGESAKASMDKPLCLACYRAAT